MNIQDRALTRYGAVGLVTFCAAISSLKIWQFIKNKCSHNIQNRDPTSSKDMRSAGNTTKALSTTGLHSLARNIRDQEYYGLALEIANRYEGGNTSGKNEKEFIDKSLNFYDQYINSLESHERKSIGNTDVELYIHDLLNSALKVEGITPGLLKAFIAVHDAGKMIEVLENIGEQVTDENKQDYYLSHDEYTPRVMEKFGFSSKEIKLFESNNAVRKVVDAFDVLGQSPFLQNIISEGQPLLRSLLETKTIFMNAYREKESITDNLEGISAVVGVSFSSATDVAEKVFLKQFCILNNKEYLNFKENNKDIVTEFISNLVKCRDEKILISNPRVLFETLGFKIPQGDTGLDKDSSKNLALSLVNFNKIFKGEKDVVTGIVNNRGTESEFSATRKREEKSFIVNNFHYPQCLELFSLRAAVVEGSTVKASGVIGATK